MFRVKESATSVLTRTGALANRIVQFRDSRLFLAVAGPLLVVYLLTATWSFPTYNDVSTNALSAWSLGTQGTVYLDEHVELADYYGYATWIVPAGNSAVSKYPPGASLMAAPLYAVWPQEARDELVVRGGAFGWSWPSDVEPFAILVPPLGPAAITAAFATASAVGLLAVAFRKIGGSFSGALVGAYVAGLGTAAWSLASDQLWQHGPAMLWIALALVLSDVSLTGSGLAFGAAILTRPPLALIAAGAGLYRSVKERSVRPALLVGSGALLGLTLFLSYNSVVFGSPTVSAGYGTGFQGKLFSAPNLGYLRNVVLAAVSFDRGLLIWSPFLIVLLPGLRSAWRVAPGWSRGAALGGVAYLLVQYKANRYSGLDNALSYRYPLEALTAAAPLLFLSYREWVATRPKMVKAFVASSILSILFHIPAALQLARL